jgi:hypothetical protein
MAIGAVVGYDLLEFVHEVISNQFNLLYHHCSFLGLVLKSLQDQFLLIFLL